MIRKILRRIDNFQQRHKLIAFPFAVVKKFGDDQAGYLAALIAYYGFFSLFPLLLVLVSLLGFVLHGNPHLQQSILNSALRNFPVIGPQLTRDVSALKSGTALGIGIAGTLWAGLGVTMAAQYAMNRIWDIPRRDWPNFLFSRIRGMILLGLLGTITVASTFLSGFGSSSAGPTLSVIDVLLRIGGIAVSLLLNGVLFTLAYRVLTVKNLGWRTVLPGAITAAVLWTSLQSLGGFYVTHQLKNASEVYGTFAAVIGLLVWIYLGAQITLYCAEINVVRARHLWPRGMFQPPLTEGDKEVYTAAAKQTQLRPEQTVDVRFHSDETEQPDLREERPTGTQ
jgi:YihY family inner membrane protein